MAEEGGFGRQARSLVAQEFERQGRDLKQLQAHEAKAREEGRARQERGFADSRDAAVVEHAAQIRSLDARERHALEEIGARRNSLQGRIVRLFRRGHYARQEEAARQLFEARRMDQHRRLEATKERQFQAETKARDRHIRETDAARARQAKEREDLAQWQEAQRERLTKARERSLADARLREASRELSQERPHGRAIERG